MKLSNFEEIKQYFRNSNHHYLFVSPTNFNVLGIEKWVSGWTNVSLIDVFDGNSEATILPSTTQFPVFDNVEAVNEFLLQDKNCQLFIKSQKNKKLECLFLFYSEHLENIVREMGLKLIMPDHKLVKHVDNKIVTTELAEQANVPCVPNAIGEIDSYAKLMSTAEEHNLGTHLVIQKSYGDSGKTTYFVSTPEDFENIRLKIKGEKVKIMKYIRCISTAIEGCATRSGTFVGPLLGELIGEPTLTPYPGGWCGNQFNQHLFSPETRRKARILTEQFGNTLYKEGYRGYFEVDYLIDLDTNELYLGELNPRLTGITAITNLSQFCRSHVPLLMLHLLEFSEQEFDLAPQDYNEPASLAGACEDSGQLIVKHLKKDMEYVIEAPVTGVYRIIENSGLLSLELIHASEDRYDAQAPDEVFLFRVMNADEFTYEGADLAIVFTNFSYTDKLGKIHDNTLALISAIRQLFSHRVLTDDELDAIERYRHVESTKANY